MIRMQVQFTEPQAGELRARAHDSGRSMADLVREAVREFLRRDGRPDRQDLVRRARQLHGRFHSRLPDLAEEHDRYLAESLEP